MRDATAMAIQVVYTTVFRSKDTKIYTSITTVISGVSAKFPTQYLSKFTKGV